ncbi:MAG: hypothetical protein WDZ49_09475 [Litorilinea sp.]
MRENVLMIRLTEAERRMIDALAKVEKLPVSTLARRRLLFEAEQRGIFPVPEKHEDTESVGRLAGAFAA